MSEPQPKPSPERERLQRDEALVEAEARREWPEIRMSRSLARFSDDLVKVPGTDLGIGLDAIVGLVPGIGDVFGTSLSAAIMTDAVRQRVPLTVLARMGWNMVLDVLLGLVPVVGDAADVLHRANRKNYRLLERCVAENRHIDVSVRSYFLLAALMVVGSVLVALALGIFIVWAVVSGLISLLC